MVNVPGKPQNGQAPSKAREKAGAIGESLLWIAWLAVMPAVMPAWASDAVQPLDIKPGLWEITLTVETSGQPPMTPEVLAKLTPEERATIEAKAKERAAEGPRTTVKRSCLDEKELQRPLVLTFGGEEGQGCRQTVVNASRTRQEIRVDCGKFAQQGDGTVRIEAADRENVKVLSSWSATNSSRTMKMRSTATLRWLGAVCEAVFAAGPEAAAPKTVPPAAAPRGTRQAAVGGELRSPGASATDAQTKGSAPLDAAYYYKLGREQTARNDLREALRSLGRAIELDPRRDRTYNARGYVYLRLQNFANAIADFSDAIRLRPDYANAYRNRAIARRHAGDEQGAAADSRRAAELENRR